jgi:hypothetical protein
MDCCAIPEGNEVNCDYCGKAVCDESFLLTVLRERDEARDLVAWIFDHEGDGLLEMRQYLSKRYLWLERMNEPSLRGGDPS